MSVQSGQPGHGQRTFSLMPANGNAVTGRVNAGCGTMFFPVIRYGLVCGIDTPIGRGESESIAQELKKDAPRIRKSICETWDAAVGDSHLEIKPAGDQQAHIEDMGLTPIVRFSTDEIKWKRYTLRARALVAVCCERRQSKVWYRISMTGSGSGKTEDLTLDEVSSFFQDSEAICDRIVRRLIEEYGTSLRRVLPSESPTPSLGIVVKAVNSRRKLVKRFLQRLRAGELGSVEDAMSMRDAVEALGDFLELSGFDTKTGGRLVRRRESDESSSGWQFPNTRLQQSIYHCAQLVKPRQSLDYVGIASSTDKEYSPDVASMQTSRDLVREVARLF